MTFEGFPEENIKIITSKTLDWTLVGFPGRISVWKLTKETSGANPGRIFEGIFGAISVGINRGIC